MSSYAESFTIKQLIDELKKYPEDTRVLCHNGGGYISIIDKKSIVYDTDSIIERELGKDKKVIILQPE